MLPQINDVPKYTMTIPSTGKKVSYRPFLVKEQKVLLIAMESQDETAIVQSMVDTISSCVDEELNIGKLATFDVEYMFTQIRGKSVGEKSTIGLKCKKCEHENEYTVNLDEIKIKVPKNKNKIKLNDNYMIEMSYPTYNHIITLNNLDVNTVTEALIEVVSMSLDKLYTEDEVISFNDYTHEDIITFMNTLNPAQLESLMEFVMNTPKLKHDISFKCEKCETQNKLTLEGIQDFF